jgi:hypothetical protein
MIDVVQFAEFCPAPPRWLVVRKTCPCSSGPPSPQKDAIRQGSTASTGFIGKKGLPCASDAPARKAVDVRVPIREAERALFARLRL